MSTDLVQVTNQTWNNPKKNKKKITWENESSKLLDYLRYTFLSMQRSEENDYNQEAAINRNYLWRPRFNV